MRVAEYLERIGFFGPIVPDSSTLKELHLAHLLTVPFENLSLHRDEPIVLEEGALFEKIVVRRRGGFCYELNGLFAALLSRLGYSVSMLSARVARDEGGFTPEFDHMTLRVEAAFPWLVDVGFGDNFREPLRLDTQEVQAQGSRSYKIWSSDGSLYLFERLPHRDWKVQYSFTLEPHQWTDYDRRCAYHQSSPDSHFQQNRICTRATPDGRLTLTDQRFITSSLEGTRREQTVGNELEFSRLLEEFFGIVL